MRKYTFGHLKPIHSRTASASGSDPLWDVGQDEISVCVPEVEGDLKAYKSWLTIIILQCIEYSSRLLLQEMSFYESAVQFIKYMYCEAAPVKELGLCIGEKFQLG